MLVALILLAPLYVYSVYMKSVYEIQNELQLKQRSHVIVRSMENFDPKREEYFAYPRFKTFESGLYDLHFKPIFTLIEHPLTTYSPGYHLEEGYAYLIIPLPEHRYFGASYLIVGNTLSYVEFYQQVLIILLSIVILVFVFSLFFLDRFAVPFKRLNQKLDNFIKDSMHEINTPLAIINVNIDLFNRNNAENRYLKRIKAATKTLANIYNDMDYLIKNENLDMRYEPIDLSAFLKERIEYFNEVAILKDIEIFSTIQESVMINFNPIQLQRIVDNTLSNAIKYSHEDSVIEIKLKSDTEGCSLIFKDFGIGIEDTRKIFERYYREDTDKGGFGIGLNIVRAIVDEAGIVLDVDSEYKKGSRFSYRFPASMLL